MGFSLRFAAVLQLYCKSGADSTKKLATVFSCYLKSAAGLSKEEKMAFAE